MCVTCQAAFSNNIKSKPKPIVNEGCLYTLEELKLLAKSVDNRYLTSQINVYSFNCNRFKKEINELIESLQ